MSVRTLSHAAVMVMLALSMLGTATLAAELAGATLPDTLSAGEKTLKLNGLGLRKKAMFKVYVGGLYLESPSKDAGGILASDQARAIRMHFLRDLTKAQLVEAFQEGFEANVKDKAGQKAAFDKMLALVPDCEGRWHTDVYLRAWKGHDASSGRQRAGYLRREGLRRRDLLDLARPQAAFGGPEEGDARLIRRGRRAPRGADRRRQELDNESRRRHAPVVMVRQPDDDEKAYQENVAGAPVAQRQRRSPDFDMGLGGAGGRAK